MKKKPRKVIVCVTQQDIDKGVKHNHSYCPIGRALRRRANIPICVGAYITTLHKGTPGPIDLSMPEAATQFVHDFDTGLPVKPSRFVLKELVLV